MPIEGLPAVPEIFQAQSAEREAELQREHAFAVHGCHKNIQTGEATVETYSTLANLLEQANRSDEAITVYQSALERFPDSAQIYLELVHLLRACGQNQSCLETAERAVRANPHSLPLQFMFHLFLPCVYQSSREVAHYRHRFSEGLEKLSQNLRLDRVPEQRAAMRSIRNIFYLSYQGKNDRDLQETYGGLVHRIMAANYPLWAKPLPSRSESRGKSPRVGYVSAHLWNHSVAKVTVGWFRNRQRDDLLIYCYHIGGRCDQMTREYGRYANVFRHIPGNLEAICEQILADRLDLLVFLDLGMSPLSMKLAGLRLAPIQATTWAHPVTSGFPTIDYFISNELMEAPRRGSHYTEEVFRLPKELPSKGV